MRYRIIVACSAHEQFRCLDARWRAAVVQALRKYLEERPACESKSRIKRLRGLSRPQYRLRVGPVRVYYDVDEAQKRVEILGFVKKPDTAEWLEEHGEEQ